MTVPMTILVVDDDRAVAKSLNLHLNHQGYDTLLAYSYEEACRAIDNNLIDLVLSDLCIGVHTGIDVIRYARQEQKDCEVFIITAHGNLETAIEAMTLGARDYLLKPLNIDELLLKIATIAKDKDLSRTVELLRREIDDTSAGIFLGEDPQMTEALRLIHQVAETDAPVLLEGASGTGKNVLARYIHSLSPRRSGSFVSVNCAALPETLIESELFGHRKGSFTGAVDNRRGLFEQAAGGSILLDEISEMPPSSQPKLLHVLEQQRIRRVGDDRELPLDCRVIISTNRNLAELTAKGGFRQDLYYRIAVFRIALPALRERAGDIVPFAYHFLAKHVEALRREVKSISTEAEQILASYSYPGNIRELENIIQRAIILCDESTLRAEHLPMHLTEEPGRERADVATLSSIEEMEVAHIRRVLRHCEGNVMRTAKILGIARSSLWRKMKKHEIN